MSDEEKHQTVTKGYLDRVLKRTNVTISWVRNISFFVGAIIYCEARLIHFVEEPALKVNSYRQIDSVKVDSGFRAHDLFHKFERDSAKKIFSLKGK